MRLINADALVIEINAKIETLSSEENDRASAVCSALESVIDAITDAEKVDDEHVRHGRWFVTEYEYFCCSLCYRSYFNGCDSTKEAKLKLENGDYYQYCPNCGAKMDGGT